MHPPFSLRGRIGFIGLGQMGAPMARNFARAGFALADFDRARISELARELKAEAPHGLRELGGAADHTAVAKYWERLGGAEIPTTVLRLDPYEMSAVRYAAVMRPAAQSFSDADRCERRPRFAARGGADRCSLSRQVRVKGRAVGGV